MPSLIYITRIRPFSVELARALESSGSHVKSFGPGEITADECILVMTSEAVLAGLRVSGLATGQGRAGAPSPPSQAIPPLPDIQRHFGADNAVWNSIKAAESGESTVGKRQPALGRSLRSRRWRVRITISALSPARPGSASSDRTANGKPSFAGSACGERKRSSERSQPRCAPLARSIHRQSSQGARSNLHPLFKANRSGRPNSLGERTTP